MAHVTGADVASFLGQGDNPELVALAGEHAVIVTAMVKAYTRANGFEEGTPNEELAAVITTASARLVANPEQLDTTIGGVRTGTGFTSFSLAETFVLNRHRKKATG